MNEKFTRWTKWKDRNLLENISQSGIYCLAISEKDISKKNFNWISDLKYIGMTNSKKGLKGRLQQFDNTINGKLQHGGADRFKYKHQNYEALIGKLFVSVWNFPCDVNSVIPGDLLIMGEVCKTEYVCLAKYVKSHKKLPEFNDKLNSPKYSLTIGREMTRK